MSAHSFDLDLAPLDVQAVHNADSVASFLARLGYDTRLRTAQTAANLGLPEPVQRRIKRLELLSDNHRFLQVYLFELKSVTVADVKAISRTFRDKAGNYLFVVTADYEYLDFVLLDRISESATAASIGIAAPALTPRRFAVDRRRPTLVQLKVLRRFTWTEADAFAQFDKLRQAYDLAYWSKVHFNNRGLFSDYYLCERLPARDGRVIEFEEWREDPKTAYQRLRAIWKSAPQFAGKKTSELIGILYEPALRELGFAAKTATSQEAGTHLRLEDPKTGALLGVCLPYPWGRELDRKDDAHDVETPEMTPTFTVVDLLAKEKTPWVVLTNGILWRLYSAKAHSRATNYYEVDANDVLGREGFHQDVQDAFRYFWLLFRAQAFIRVEREWLRKRQFLNLLDRLLLGSEEYAKELGESLKSRVFTKVFPVLAEGFIAAMRQRGDKGFDETTLATIYQGTLVLLYRLLFLLYAESRDLLPVQAPEYQQSGLQRLKDEIRVVAGNIPEANAHAAGAAQERTSRINKGFSASEFRLWDRLKKLFAVIDKGSEVLNVPRYNGGLFQAERDANDDSGEAVAIRFLERERIADRDLALALDLLARDEDQKTKALVFIDYKSLGVRQLGSIYEGLLQFKLRIATQKLGVTKDKTREVYKPFTELTDREKKKAEAQGACVLRGRAYLENDKRERKATGSYYTPDHIVKFIVERAVGPVLEAKFEGLRTKLRDAHRQRREFFKQQEEFTKRGMKPKPVEPADLIGRELVDELFNVKVLDPAMGSGHFLVEAVDYVTDKILEFLNAFPWNPVLVHLSRMRDDIEEEMEALKIEIDFKRLTDVNLIKRQVLKRCIYGVDLNPMAVELAKVSVWLDCFTLGAPLSFLDHHLRCGNSLIGSTVAEVDAIRESKGQLTLTGTSDWQGLAQAVEATVDLGGMPDITPGQVLDSKKHFESALADVEVFKRVLNLHAARSFVKCNGHKTRGNPTILDEMLCSGELFEWAHGRISSPLVHTSMAAAGKDALTQVERISTERKFFHWELEFPEVFCGRRLATQNAVGRLEGAGFDAVIGNPPYVRIQGLSNEDARYFENRFASARGKFDIYLLFIENGFRLIRSGGILGYINPNKFITADYGSGIRKFISGRRALQTIVDFEDRQIFEGISTYVALLFLQNSECETVKVRLAEPENLYSAPTITIPAESLGAAPWVLKPSAFRIREGLPTLGDVCDSIFQGLITGGDPLLVGKRAGNAAAFGTEVLKYEPGIQRSFLRGKEVRRYELQPAGSLVIYPYHHVNGKDELMEESHIKSHFPDTYRYLRKYRDELNERGSENMNYESWYSLWCPRQMHRFASPKILTQVLSARASFALDGKGEFWFAGGGNAGVYGITPSKGLMPMYLLGVLNSNPFDHLLQSVSSRFRGGYFSYARRFIERVPIPVADDAVQREIASLVKQCLDVKSGSRIDIDRQIDEAVEHLYGS